MIPVCILVKSKRIYRYTRHVAFLRHILSLIMCFVLLQAADNGRDRLLS
jgi:hypothetical protein